MDDQIKRLIGDAEPAQRAALLADVHAKAVEEANRLRHLIEVQSAIWFALDGAMVDAMDAAFAAPTDAKAVALVVQRALKKTDDALGRLRGYRTVALNEAEAAARAAGIPFIDGSNNEPDLPF